MHQMQVDRKIPTLSMDLDHMRGRTVGSTTSTVTNVRVHLMQFRGVSAYHFSAMGALLALSIWVCATARSKALGVLPITGLLTVGLLSTGIGDVANSSISPLSSTPQKLTWALLWFGIGYAAYVAFLIIELGKVPGKFRKRSLTTFFVAVPILAVANYLSWSARIEPLVGPHDILKVGSLLLSVTLYAALPALSMAIFVGSNWSTEALVLLFGTGFLAFSDLILFATWLPSDGPVSLADYALNWIFYFGGQSLFFIGAITYHCDELPSRH